MRAISLYSTAPIKVTLLRSFIMDSGVRLSFPLLYIHYLSIPSPLLFKGNSFRRTTNTHIARLVQMLNIPLSFQLLFFLTRKKSRESIYPKWIPYEWGERFWKAMRESNRAASVSCLWMINPHLHIIHDSEYWRVSTNTLVTQNWVH